MYRKRARAAHVLQQPSVPSTAQATAAANGPPLGGAAPGYTPGGFDPSAAGGGTQAGGGGVQLFNPMTYQNGYVNDPQVGGPGQQQAAPQFHSQPQQPLFLQNPVQNPAQFPPGGQAQSQYPGGHQAQPQAQYTGGGVAPQQPQGDQYQYPEHLHQEQASTDQQQGWSAESVSGDWSRQPSQESNNQLSNHVDQQHREPSQESRFSEQSQQPQQLAADQSWQQAYHQTAQQTVDQQSQSAGHQEQQQNQQHQEQQQQQQQLELILDPSGQWCWDYHAQQWVPYYAEQHVQNQTSPGEQDQVVASDQQQAAHQVNGGWEASQDQDSQVSNQNVVHEQPIVNAGSEQQNIESRAEQVLTANIDSSQQSQNQVSLQPSSSGAGEMEAGPYVHDVAAPSQQGLQDPYENNDRNLVQNQADSMSHQNLVQGMQNLDLGIDASATYDSNNLEVSQNVPAASTSHQQQDQSNVLPGHRPSNEFENAAAVVRQASAESQNLESYQGLGMGPVEKENPPPPDMGEMPGQAMGPPDLVDMRQYNQPEIVNDTNHHPPQVEVGAHAPPPPDMFASLPISSYGYSGSAGVPQPDIEQMSAASDPSPLSPGLVGQPDLGGQLNNQQPIASAAPDLTAQSVIQSHTSDAQSMQGSSTAPDPYLAISGPASLPARMSGGASAHDQHYDFYKDQIESAMPDLTSGQRPSRDVNSSRANHPARRSSQDKAPDILRTEPVVPTTDRNLYMETGELQEEDAHRVSHDIPGVTAPVSGPSFVSVQPQTPASSAKPPSDLPPMVGGNEPPMVGTSDPPSIVRMVVGDESQTSPPSVPPPMMMPIPPPNQRMVEGESTAGSAVPPLPAREIEGEAGSDVRPVMYPNTIDRTIEGEDETSVAPMVPPPVQTREVEGEPQPLPPPPTTRMPPPPGVGMRAPPPSARVYPGGQLPPPGVTSPGDQDFGAPSSTQSTPLDSSPIHQLVSPAPAPPSSSPTTEVRSAAAGSDKRDETVMGGPPPPVKAPPLPTPGRAVAGQESTQPGQVNYPPQNRRRGDKHKKSTYDSDDDNIPESESEINNVQKRRIQPRRNLSPKSNRAPRPVRGADRLNRSSTDRDDDSDRKHDYYRDDEDYYNGNRNVRNYDRRNYGKDRRHTYDDDREDDRRSLHHRDDDRRSVHGREEDRRSLYGRDDDRRSYHGGRRIKQERHRDDRYRDDGHYRRGRMDSDMDRESYYGDETLNRSRPGSRTGSVSHYDPNDSLYRGGGLSGGMAFFQQQLLQQQHQYQYQMQYQLQAAVQEMEKVLSNPENVNTYKAYWDTYGKQPHLMDKLRMENPVLHHLLLHFRQNYWHLVEKKPVIKEEMDVTTNKGETTDLADREVEEFAKKFHQKSPSHRPESREAGLESTIASPGDESAADQITSSGAILPERLTPLMFSRPHVCARISASGLLVKVEAHSPRDGQSATVELHSVTSLLHHTQEYRQLAMFPGPLRPKETHKNDVIKFCERKIQDCRERRMMDKDSYELIWRMLILLLRQKGQVEGSDLADLLISDKSRLDTSMDTLPTDRSRGGSSYRGQLDAEETASMSSFSEDHGEKTDRTMSSKTYINSGASQEEYVSKFRSYLLHGNKQEGLEFAMKVGLWGHALFLASKMDQRTYASVMTRFANGLAVNDPLQTLYQLMSARIPAAMKNFADQRLGDWRPHLAMILSNPYPGSDINRRSMVTLGDTLLSKGQIYAAQFCYIVSALEFGTFTKKTSKLVLLLSMPGEKSVNEFATNESIQCTEIYEFVQKLGNPEYEMPTLQPFKLLHAIRLLEVGLTSQAQDYCREIAEFVIKNPSKVITDFLPDFLNQLETLSDKLKYQDPQYTTRSGELSEIPDPEWLVKLHETVHTINYGGVGTSSDVGEMDTMSYNDTQSGYYNSEQYQQHQQSGEYQAYSQQVSDPGLQQMDQENANNYAAYENVDPNQNQYSSGQEYSEDKVGTDPSSGQMSENLQNGWNHMQSIPEQTEQENTGPVQTMYDPTNYGEHGNVEQDQGEDPGAGAVSQPAAAMPMFNPSSLQPMPGYDSSQPVLDPATIPPPSLPTFDPSAMGAGSRKTSLSDPDHRRNSMPPPLNVERSGQSEPPAIAQPPIPQPKENSVNSGSKSPESKSNEKKNKGEPSKKSSWLGGIFGKILRPPNQVHLPDDNNKTIYYDDKLGKWVNTEEDEDASAPAAPPPMDPAFMNKKSDPAAPLGMPGAPSPASSPLGELPPAAPTSFRATKRRGRAYVDVIGQSGITKPMSGTGPPMLLPDGGPSPDQQPSSLPPMMFNPGAAPLPGAGDDGPSSLQLGDPPSSSPEESTGGGEPAAPPGMPMMFNPSSMGSVAAPPTF